VQYKFRQNSDKCSSIAEIIVEFVGWCIVGLVIRAQYDCRDVEPLKLQCIAIATFVPRDMECRRGLAMRILSVSLSVKRVDCDKTKEKSVRIFIPCERPFSLVFWEEEWLVGATSSTLNFGSTGSRLSEIADFEPIIARSASAVIPREKSSMNINRKSLTRFPMSLRWPSYVASKSPKGGSKTQNGRFSSKIALFLKKVCYKVYSCKNCQRQNCRALIGLTIHAKMIGGERHLLPKILGQTDRVGAKSPIFHLFSLVAPQL